MANLKFSGFTENAAIVQADHFLVGYDDDGTAGGSNPKNNRWTFAQVAAGLAAVTATPYSLYASDGILAATERKIGIPSSGVLRIQNADGTPADLLTIKEDSSITIGEGAAHSNATGGPTSVVIGASAATNGSNGMVAIGGSASAGNGQSTCIGYNSTTSNPYVTNLGAYTQNAADYGVSLGFGSRGSGAYNVQLGYQARGTGANSITITSCGSTVTPSTANAFGVYITSASTPDFQVIGSGESTLNTSLKVTGQAYTELHDTTNATLTVNWNNGNIQELTSLTGSLTFTASNPKAGATYILTLAQTGTVTATWTGVKFPGATAPTLSGAGKTDVITLICYDAAANSGAGAYYGSSVLNFTT